MLLSMKGHPMPFNSRSVDPAVVELPPTVPIDITALIRQQAEGSD